MLLRPSHFDRSAGALENAEIHNEQLTDQGFLDPRAKRGGFCPTTHLEITEKLLRCRLPSTLHACYASSESMSGGQCIALLYIFTSFSIFLPEEDRDKQEKMRREEAANHYENWLKTDVVYIITDEERAVFNKLSTDEERDAFIEQFWRRRDPDPGTFNEFKEEHYRRIAYANEHFTSGIEGWATDRGRVYIRFGRPTSIEDHLGGPYRRRPEEGGGVTSTYAFQRWFYNYIPGVGSGIEIEFVDSSKTGEYRIALRPSEKDALWMSGGGFTTHERLGQASREQLVTSDLLMRNLGLPGEANFSRGSRLFDRLREYFALAKPPELKFKDLRTQVDTRTIYNPIPLKVSAGAYRVADNALLVPLTIEIPARELTYKPFGSSVRRAVIALYGKVEDLVGRTVYEFEDLLAADSTSHASLKDGTHFLYQKQLPLGPGRYKVTIVAQEQDTKRIASTTVSVLAPAVEVDVLDTSPLVLANRFTSSSPSQTLSDPFVTPSGLKVYPNVTGEFAAESTLHFYVEVYEVAVDQASQRPAVEALLTLSCEGKPLRTEEPKLLQLADRIVLLRKLDLKGLPTGSFQLILQLHDRISGQRRVRHAAFKVK